VIAAWAVLTGVVEIVAAVRLRRVLDNEWLVVVAGILSIWAGPDWTRYSSDIVGT
jgi:uncharacterized membrane protein HdeD (DUF308 family)